MSTASAMSSHHVTPLHLSPLQDRLCDDVRTEIAEFVGITTAGMALSLTCSEWNRIVRSSPQFFNTLRSHYPFRFQMALEELLAPSNEKKKQRVAGRGGGTTWKSLGHQIVSDTAGFVSFFGNRVGKKGEDEEGQATEQMALQRGQYWSIDWSPYFCLRCSYHNGDAAPDLVVYHYFSPFSRIVWNGVDTVLSNVDAARGVGTTFNEVSGSKVAATSGGVQQTFSYFFQSHSTRYRLHLRQLLLQPSTRSTYPPPLSGLGVSPLDAARKEKILLVGLDGCGKTTLLWNLKEELQLEENPSPFGFEILNVAKDGKRCLFAHDIEISRKLSSNHRRMVFGKVVGVVFIVDSSDFCHGHRCHHEAKTAAVELRTAFHQTLEHLHKMVEEEREDKFCSFAAEHDKRRNEFPPVLILANKQSPQGAVSKDGTTTKCCNNIGNSCSSVAAGRVTPLQRKTP